MFKNEVIFNVNNGGTKDGTFFDEVIAIGQDANSSKVVAHLSRCSCLNKMLIVSDVWLLQHNKEKMFSGSYTKRILKSSSQNQNQNVYFPSELFHKWRKGKQPNLLDQK